MNAGGWWGRAEPDLRSLYEWIDLQQNYQSDRRGGILGAIIGCSWGVMGGLIGVLAGGLGIPPAISVTVPLSIAALATIAGVSWYFRGRTEDDKAAARIMSEMRGFYWKLLTARWQGNVKSILGESESLTLNQGAYEYLKCRSALRSAAWQAVDSRSPWFAARSKTETAMNVAMSRLITMIGQGASPTEPAVRTLLQDMERTAEEAAATANRLAEHRGIPGDASNELRKALSEMQALNQADEEFADLTQEVANQ